MNKYSIIIISDKTQGVALCILFRGKSFNIRTLLGSFFFYFFNMVTLISLFLLLTILWPYRDKKRSLPMHYHINHYYIIPLCRQISDSPACGDDFTL